MGPVQFYKFNLEISLSLSYAVALPEIYYEASDANF